MAHWKYRYAIRCGRVPSQRLWCASNRRAVFGFVGGGLPPMRTPTRIDDETTPRRSRGGSGRDLTHPAGGADLLRTQ